MIPLLRNRSGSGGPSEAGCWPRICMVGPYPPQAAGGVPQASEEVAQMLRREGAAVTLASRHPTRAGRLREVGAEVLLRAGHYDTLVVQLFSGNAAYAAAFSVLAGRLWGRRVVLHVHGGNLPTFLAETPLPLVRAYRAAHAVVCPSGYLADAMRQLGLPARVIPDIFYLERYPFRHRRGLAPRLLWLRTFHPLYNPTLALQVFADVRTSHPEATLTMAGVDRGMEAEVRARAEAMGLRDVSFTGFVQKADVPAVMAAHDVYLSTPHIDNNPTTVIEALACGLVVVATRVGGVPYLVEDGRTGLLVPDDDAGAMAEAVRRALADPDLAGRLSQAGRRSVERYTWPHVAPLWRAVLTGDAMAS